MYTKRACYRQVARATSVRGQVGNLRAERRAYMPVFSRKRAHLITIAKEAHSFIRDE